MAGYTKISDPCGVADSRRRGMAGAWKATALAAALLVGGSIEAIAVDPPDPPDPAQNKVWGGCVLGAGDGGLSGTVDGLIADIKEGVGIDESVTVSFVVVYTNANNNGQPLTAPSGAFTGPVICTNPAVDITAKDANGAPLQETTDIPGEIDPDAGHIDIRSSEELSIIQYQIDSTGPFENRVCHTTDENVDCFRIFEPD